MATGKDVRERLAGIDLDADSAMPGQSRPPMLGSSSAKARGVTSGVGLVMKAIQGGQESIEMERRLAEANAKLSAFEQGKVAILLDPQSIKRSKWANRDQANFETEEFREFMAELAHSNGNIEPIKVRPLPGPDEGGAAYEVVFGHRRHEGCLRQNLKVLAIIDEDIDDRALFTEMDRENRHRQNLSAFEQGRMYNNALQEGLFPSLRELCAKLNVNISDASRYVQLAKLPPEVIKAFPSPLELQVRFAKPLNDALQRDPEGVLKRAEHISLSKEKLKASDVLQRLVTDMTLSSTNNDEVRVSGKLVFSVRKAPKGRTSLLFEPGVLTEELKNEICKLFHGDKS